MTAFCWLIEAPGSNYLGARHLGCHQFYWTTDHNKAIRFMSEEQATATMMAVREICPPLFDFARNLGDAWAREHGWLSDVPVDAAQIADAQAVARQTSSQANDPSTPILRERALNGR